MAIEDKNPPRNQQSSLRWDTMKILRDEGKISDKDLRKFVADCLSGYTGDVNKITQAIEAEINQNIGVSKAIASFSPATLSSIARYIAARLPYMGGLQDAISFFSSAIQNFISDPNVVAALTDKLNGEETNVNMGSSTAPSLTSPSQKEANQRQEIAYQRNALGLDPC